MVVCCPAGKGIDGQMIMIGKTESPSKLSFIGDLGWDPDYWSPPMAGHHGLIPMLLDLVEWMGTAIRSGGEIVGHIRDLHPRNRILPCRARPGPPIHMVSFPCSVRARGLANIRFNRSDISSNSLIGSQRIRLIHHLLV